MEERTMEERAQAVAFEAGRRGFFTAESCQEFVRQSVTMTEEQMQGWERAVQES